MISQTNTKKSDGSLVWNGIKAETEVPPQVVATLEISDVKSVTLEFEVYRIRYEKVEVPNDPSNLE